MRRRAGEVCLGQNAVRKGVAAFLILAVGLTGLFLYGKKPGRGTSAATGAHDQHEDEHTGKLKIGKQKYTYDDTIKAYLIMGTDDSGNEEEKGDDYVGSMADYLAVIIMDKTKETCGVVEINRNTITDVNIIDQYGDGEALAVAQICIAHAYGGSKWMSCQNTVRAVSRVLGKLPIDGYYAVGMSDIPKVNHAVGGVEVTIRDDFSQTDPSLVMGKTIHLSDEQAFHYLHDRMNVGGGDNIARMERQETYLKAVLEKASGDDGAYAMAIWDALEDDAVTDMSDRDISALQNAYSAYRNEGFFSLEGDTIEADTFHNGRLHEEFYPNEEFLADTLTDLCNLSPMVEE